MARVQPCSRNHNTYTPHMATFQVPLLPKLKHKCAHPPQSSPFIPLPNWHYQATIMIDWACISQRGWCHLITVWLSILFTDFLLFFCLSVCLKSVSWLLLNQPPCLPVWLIESLAFFLNHILQSCHCKSLSYLPTVFYQLTSFHNPLFLVYILVSPSLKSCNNSLFSSPFFVKM